ncbi:hypothetical protein CEXT_702081 [Caerostris extrusa]|uniref:Uncharacterized protein n=1 Tax=Caerostris extrusa TaxID=172846 RepID=A0AAV4Y3G0_CAEEX|nr:hypothetical protein CEXT_702081 [Caerostris extrusa]
MMMRGHEVSKNKYPSQPKVLTTHFGKFPLPTFCGCLRMIDVRKMRLLVRLQSMVSSNCCKSAAMPK